MLPFFDARQHAHGVIAVGQFATGFIAIGQVAVGVVAIGQIAQGIVAIGQASVGVATVGMITLGAGRSLGMISVSVLDAVGMIAVGWRARGMAPLSLRVGPTTAAPETINLGAILDGSDGCLAVETRGAEPVEYWCEGRVVPLKWDPFADGEPERLRGRLFVRVTRVQGELVATGASAAPVSMSARVVRLSVTALLACGSTAALALLVIQPLLDALR